jgi:hypothetical protein
MEDSVKLDAELDDKLDNKDDLDNGSYSLTPRPQKHQVRTGSKLKFSFDFEAPKFHDFTDDLHDGADEWFDTHISPIASRTRSSLTGKNVISKSKGPANPKSTAKTPKLKSAAKTPKEAVKSTTFKKSQTSLKSAPKPKANKVPVRKPTFDLNKSVSANLGQKNVAKKRSATLPKPFNLSAVRAAVRDPPKSPFVSLVNQVGAFSNKTPDRLKRSTKVMQVT